MRLTCPNCGAQYEVAEDVIPLSGRDVQCSACGNTWFQRPGEEPDPAALEIGRAAEAPEPHWEPEPDGAPVSAPETADDTAPMPEPDRPDAPARQDTAAEERWPEPKPDIADEPAPEATPDDRPVPEQPQRRALDPEIADMLREEAELARTARDGGQLETQTDLGLDDAPSAEEQRSREAQARMARLRGEADGPAEAEAGTRREMLPDIDEINDTLRGEAAAGAAAATVASAETARKGGFRRGFVLVVVLAILAVVVYLLAPTLSEQFPTLEPPLTGYTDWVDGVRLWLDLKLQALMSGGEAPEG